ncbi:MAG: nitroreductase family protein [Chloroflexi bacterium]|nr:nitroreductase family protein [Chloroflexota bacterium]
MVIKNQKNSRKTEASVEPMFVERWSSKAFTEAALSDGQIASLFEAAHWAPSASNRQPWVFVYATDGPDRDRFNALLNENNALWAPKSSMMILVFARIVDAEGKKIRTAQFDTGAAWMSLALQANRMGLNTRAMGGIDLNAAYDVAGVSREIFETICAISVGVPGTDDDIHPRMVRQNFANDRKSVSEIAFKGTYTG